jgi:hypothetical protein
MDPSAVSAPTSSSASLWDTLDHTPSLRQRVVLRYFTAVLVDLAVLNFFVEYSEHVSADSFTITLLAAMLLQALLKVTIAIEHRIAAFFNAKQGGFARFMRFFSAWLVLFGSKFLILEALIFAFGERLQFGGPLHGVVALVVVVTAMLAAEVVVVIIYRRLG